MNRAFKKRALIVDDDAPVRSSIGRVLAKASYDVAEVANGQEALVRFTSERFDIVLLDLNLRAESGWDVFERLTSSCPFVPVLIITGLPNQYHTALSAGAGAILEKPIDAPILLRTVDELITEPQDVRLRRLCGYQDDTRYVPSTRAERSRPAGRAALSHRNSGRRSASWTAQPQP